MKEKGITQRQLADELGRDQAYISERVTGKRAFSTDELDAIAKLANVLPRELIEYLAIRLAENVTPIRNTQQSRAQRKPAKAVAKPKKSVIDVQEFPEG